MNLPYLHVVSSMQSLPPPDSKLTCRRCEHHKAVARGVATLTLQATPAWHLLVMHTPCEDQPCAESSVFRVPKAAYSTLPAPAFLENNITTLLLSRL